MSFQSRHADLVWGGHDDHDSPVHPLPGGVDPHHLHHSGVCAQRLDSSQVVKQGHLNEVQFEQGLNAFSEI
jgi:hypothetical protein